jgi:hypothetical protein
VKKIIFFLFASLCAMTARSSGTACSYLDADTVSAITGLHITKVNDDGDECVYVDPTAPLNAIVQMFSQALGKAFGGTSPVRLNGAPNGVPEAQTGAGVVVREPTDAGDLTNVSVHDYAQQELSEVPAQAGCGAVTDVTGLNASSVVCLGGQIGHGGVVQNNKLVLVMYLAPGNATTDIMGKLLAAAASKMRPRGVSLTAPIHALTKK